VSNSSAPQQDASHDKPAEPVKVSGVPSQVSAAGLTKLPDKRPSRRLFGLLPGRRSM
jgi:hypothetical protein